MKMSKYEVFSGPYFPIFGLNTKIYGVFIVNTGKYALEKQQGHQGKHPLF